MGKLQSVYDDGRALRDGGIVVWGQICEAPDSLYRADASKNAPAGVIYSLDRYFRDNLHVLAHVGSKVMQAAKIDSKDGTMQRFAGKLANQRDLPMRLEVPKKMTGNREVFYTTIVVHREQLPAPFLVANQLPLLVVPGGTVGTMILPKDYWSETMKAYWVARYETRAAS